MTKEQPEPVPMRDHAPAARTYVITYAQNATPAHVDFLRSLEAYCAANKAELLVLPGRYKNPTSIWAGQDRDDEWWATEVLPYLFRGRLALGDHLTVYGDISIQPTAVRPLTGFEVFAGTHSAIFGHPKIQLSTIATAKRRYPRILTTTGAVTQPNYTDSKAGKKAEAHHVFGATVVEQGSRLFHVRQINAEADGSFIDLDRRYTPQGVEQAPRALALVCGDIHVDRSDKAVLDATFDRPDSVVATLDPERVIYHDLLDFNRRNHHTIRDFNDRYRRALGFDGDIVEEEIDDAIAFVDSKAPKAEPIVIQSNHDEAFDRWLREADPRQDPINARFFHETWASILRYHEDHGEFRTAFETVYDTRGAGRAVFHDRNEPLRISDIYCNFHGDKGLNGSRASPMTYAKLGVKTIIGHSHTPAILDGCYQVGVTGALEMGYNDLPSSWLNAHCVVYANGKRSLIMVIDGEWRGSRVSAPKPAAPAQAMKKPSTKVRATSRQKVRVNRPRRKTA